MTRKWPFSRPAPLLPALGALLAVSSACAAPAPTPAAPLVPGTIRVESTLAPVYPFRDGYALHLGSAQAHARLSVAPNTRVRQGATSDRHDNFEVNICLYNDDGAAYFYSVFWNPFIPAPGRLALYDSRKQYVCDLLEHISGSAASAKAARDWIIIPAPGYVGRTLSVSLPYPSYRRIPPGTYYVQVIYLARLLKNPTDTDTFDPADLKELFRTNAVPITVLDPAALIRVPRSGTSWPQAD